MMNRDYKISNDGTIFEIKEDGSISKLAKINEDGNISTISNSISRQTQDNRGWYCFFIILLIIVSIVLAVLYTRAEDNYSRTNVELDEYRNKYKNASSTTSSLRNEISNLKQEFSEFKREVAIIYPLIITDIEIANVTYDGDIHTYYGNLLYGSSTMYLKPRIKYTGLTSGNKTLKVKWYNPDGTIVRGDSSPYGFSQSQSIYVYSGDNKTYDLSGWGNSIKGNWRSGTYRIEIWYENSCLKSKTFTIY